MAEGRDVIISWSATNWITIFLMASLGFLIFGFAWRVGKGIFGTKQVA